MINVNQYNKDLERLRVILIEKNIISKDETIGVKQFYKYSFILKYGTSEGLKMEPVK